MSKLEPIETCQCRTEYNARTKELIESMLYIKTFRDFVKKLEMLCAPIHMANGPSITPILYAVQTNRLDLVSGILDTYGVMLANMGDDIGQTAALYAVQYLGDDHATPMLELLAEKGARLNIISDKGYTALSASIEYGYTKTTEFLSVRCQR